MKQNLNETATVSEDEEGEIKDNDKINNTNEYDDFSNIYIDNLINGKIKENFFEDLLNFDCGTEINEIDDNDLLKTDEIKDRFGFRNSHIPINSDTETDDDTESAEEIDIPQLGSILDSLLDSKTKEKKDVGEKTKKGRIINQDAELEYMIPTDLERRLSNIVVSKSDEMKLIGTIIHSIEGTQTVTMKAHNPEPILDIETVVFDTNKRMIGVIDNIFGTKKQPNYLVICKNAEVWQSLKPGDTVFCAPSVKNAYFTTVETHEVHHDNDSDLAFSDDEKEDQHRRQLAGLPPLAKKGDNRKRKPRNTNRPRQPHQPQRDNQRMTNPFFRVSGQPFGSGTAPPSYWSGGPAPNPMMPFLAMPPPPFLAPAPAGQLAGFPNFASYPQPPLANYQYQQYPYQHHQQHYQYHQQRPQFPPRSGRQ